ncbi:Peptidoglycan-recognition protein SC2 [Gryllus bimaculatus]|nr:Peptidoglycan-recognition protein SC2 [Gryllus bimaculatus]
MARSLLLLAALCALAAAASAACPNIISRSGWGARNPTATTQLSKKPTPYVVVHHGASSSCTTQSACASIVRSYQNQHMDVNGWADIGYNFIIGEDGNVIGFNKSTRKLPNNAALNALNNLIECGVSKGKITAAYKEIGHRQATATECPGTKLYQWVQSQSHWTSSP